jgi:digalactosyldiacylglycerol synthase
MPASITHSVPFLYFCRWYPSKYYSGLGSIFPSGDICKQIPKEIADFCILEEPEHLNWIRSAEEEGEIWTDKFNHVVGVIHTNYRAYASATAAIAAPVISGLSSLMVRAYCDKVIKLSATLQTYSPEKEVVCNAHGVRSGKTLSSRVWSSESPLLPFSLFVSLV